MSKVEQRLQWRREKVRELSIKGHTQRHAVLALVAIYFRMLCHTFDLLFIFIFQENIILVISKSNSTEAGIVSHILYRVPKKNHDAMLQICKEAYDMFKQYGILHYDAFKLSNIDVPTDGFAASGS